MGKILVIKGADFSAVAVGKVTPTGKIAIKVVASPTGGGVVTGGGSYDEGETVTITATANSGYTFKQWSDGNTSSSRTITVGSSSATYTATFEATASGYGTIILNGTENWQFNTSDEPNTSGYYNAYVMNPAVTNVKINESGVYFAEATCDNSALNRNIIDESRIQTTANGFGYFKSDPSLFLRFNSEIATSVDTLKAYLAANPVTITYKQNS